MSEFNFPEHMPTYTAGELRAVAFKDGKEIGALTFRTSSRPSRLRLNVDGQAIRGSRGDAAFVHESLAKAKLSALQKG